MPGEGSTFTLYLPLATASVSSPGNGSGTRWTHREERAAAAATSATPLRLGRLRRFYDMECRSHRASEVSETAHSIFDGERVVLIVEGMISISRASC